ncbi:MAG: IS110 family transposase, partial [Mangrovibacterium sp.]
LMPQQRKELNFKGENIYVGIDVHLRSWSVTILTEHSHFKTFNQPPEPDKLYNYLTEHFPMGNYFSAYEAGFSGLWAHYQLKELGVENIVINPADVPTSNKERVHKTDAVDSKKIARSLRAKELQGIYTITPQTQEDRSILRVRTSVVKDLTRMKTRIKMMLHHNGIKIPQQYSNSKDFPSSFVGWLRCEASEAMGIDKSAFLFVVDELEHKKKALLTITRQVRELCKQDRYKCNIELIRSVPGIGLLTGAVFLTEIENIERFENSDKFAGFIGIVPSCHSSGSKDNKGEMTSRGQKHLRASLIESAWVSIRKDPALALAYNQLCRRMEPNKAIVRIARKLVNRIYYVLKNKKEYVCSVVQ